ncbi:MAG TPA: hypothetical protein VIK45_08205 [Candidatus Dormibacteraeota bacterium]
MNDLELESRLQREMQRVACGTRGPAPRAAQARYRTAPPPMAVISKLAVGMAAVSIALSVSVVAAAAVGGSSPNQVAQAVKHAVQKCQNDQAQPDVGRGVTECVSGLVPTSLPLLPKLSVPTPSGGTPTATDQRRGTAANSGRTGPARTAQASSQPGTAGSAAQGATPSVIGTGIPGNTPLATPSSGGPAPAGAVGPSPSAVPVSTPVPSSTPLPPTPTPSPTGTIGSGTSGLEPGPSPTPLPTPAPTAVPIPTP